MNYRISKEKITREKKDNSNIIMNKNAYFVSPFVSTKQDELTKEELEDIEKIERINKEKGFKYYTVQFIPHDMIDIENYEILLYIKLSDLGNEREIKLRFGRKGTELKSTGNFEKLFLSELKNKLNN